MKIGGNHIQQIVGAYIQGAGKPASGPGGVSGPKDKVSVSDRASLLMKARQAYDSLPDVREARVSGVAARVEEGSYHVADDDIAQAMIESAKQGAQAARFAQSYLSGDAAPRADLGAAGE